jgi:hypothetical protein
MDKEEDFILQTAFPFSQGAMTTTVWMDPTAHVLACPQLGAIGSWCSL